MSEAFVSLHNGEALPLSRVPEMPFVAFRRAILDRVADGLRVCSLFAAAHEGAEGLALYAVLAADADGLLHVARTRRDDGVYPAMTPECPEVHLFEREIFEQYGLRPEGHPWLKPVRFQPPMNQSGAAPPPIGLSDFFRVRGQEVHEVAVGPVHAGVIEPGHFRFQCHGEDVFHLEISLGYQHRGVEQALLYGPRKRTPFQMETAAGDTTVGHTLAYCEAVEALAETSVPARAQALRGIALELERLANHTGDLGALAGDVGFLPTAAYCGRIRGDFLNMSAALCGSRFSRGFVRPGGTGFDLDEARVAALRTQLQRARKDVTVAVELLWDTPSVLARFEHVGAVSLGACQDIGMVGLSARACGIERDVRRDHPTGIFRVSQIPVSTAPSGDVYGRAYVRWLEIQRSLNFLTECLDSLPQTPVRAEAAPVLAPDSLAVSLIEGWRGEICHVAVTDAQGRFARYKLTDPSFHNWFGLALALRGQQISDFPLCNKSFNLSYCGFDL